ncbi:maleylpyruvate isomerase N-terminal domain-containing protein [Candidatus Poriferisodalis sp.]|uniref:maleylpyruvate isomerase N-terminal domain-containing protein n=1 Tax=Candidatus Poriferisodalis sp. TaxID=3101277 RepID=UPI003D11AD40
MTPAANSSIDSARVRALVVEAVTQSAELIDTPATAELWDQPSALEGMTVGALCAHLVRAAGATIAYLDRTPPDRRADGDLLTAVTYFHAAVDSPVHEQIKDVSASESAIGHQATADKCRQLADDLQTRLADEPADRLVAALGGRLLTLDDFCRTRLIEVLLHLDDLAISTGQTRPTTDPLGPAIIIEICIDIARNRNGDWNVLYALTRAERSSDPAVFPVF